jgi:hypothetical protein
MNRTGLRRLLPVAYVALAVYYAWAVREVISHRWQWDFDTYYYAARAYSMGEDPYDVSALRDAYPKLYHPYVYAPFTLPLFALFTHLDLVSAGWVFLALKLPALAVLILIWKRLFSTGPLDVILLLAFCALAYRQAIFIDLAAGNVAIFEQLMIWLAALCFLRKKPGAFSLLIAFSAFFKLTSILLLPMVMIDRDRRSMVSLLFAAAGFLVVYHLPWLVRPDLWEGFLISIRYLDEPGSMNASMLSFIRTCVSYFADWAGFNVGPLAALLYVIFACGLLSAAVLLLRRIDFRHRRMEFIVLTFFLYSLVLPRLKGYSFIMLIVPSLIVIRDALPNWWLRGLAVTLIFIPMNDYRSLLMSLALFLIYLYHVRRIALPRGAEPGPPPGESVAAAQPAGP